MKDKMPGTNFVTPPRRTYFADVLASMIATAQRTGFVQDEPLERSTMLEQVAERAGLDDFGDPWFEKPFDILLDALNGEARLNGAGRFFARKQFEKVLLDRLWAQRWFVRYPEILSRPVPKPVVIVGPMRSGTTRLHRLLASDRRFSHLRSFETISPVPRPDFEEVLAGKKRDFRPVLAQRIMRLARLANPLTLNIHPTGPFEPEEELGLLVASMWGMKHEAQWMIPSYGRWCESEDGTPAYRYMADLLRLIGWSQQVSSLRPWILKTPQHMLDLPALLKVFPDAKLIFTHRDPHAVVGSAASLAWNQLILYSDDVSAECVGQEWLRKVGVQIERMCSARETIPRERMIDIHYDDMERDWLSTMERVYDFIGFDISPAVPGMEDFIARSARLKRHPHCYSLEEFGLSDEDVQGLLGNYVQAYDVALEA
ncbi:MAG: sulfotransferase family protein [Sphingomonadaceae bacterium]